jgi:isopentenyl-diphosphate Delta-isomerase
MLMGENLHDLLILVDGDDHIIGHEDKARCHQGSGLLHRAFSIFLFDSRQQVLLQQRSRHKPLWPLYWSNSVCSHPRQGESGDAAAQRRLVEELGVTTPLRWLFQFRYQAAFQDRGAEHEMCAVYIGQVHDQPISADPAEIADWTWVGCEELDADVAAHPDRYTPWFRLEWEQMRGPYAGRLAELLAAPACFDTGIHRGGAR